MSLTPTKPTHDPTGDPASVARSSLARRYPPALEGLNRQRPRPEDFLHRRHSSSISYRKSHDSHTHFDYITSPLASTWTQASTAPKRHSLQTSPGNLLHASIRRSSIMGDIAASAANGDEDLDGLSPTSRRGESDMVGISSSSTHDEKSRLSQTSTSNPPSSTAIARTLSLVEQHSDLLNFIAKKERQCLDLREELQKSEDELRKLKRKWEIVIGRSLASPTMSAGVSPVNTSFRRQQASHCSTSAVTALNQVGSSSRLDALSLNSMHPQSRPSPSLNERSSPDRDRFFSHDLHHDDELQDLQPDDLTSWDPLLQRFAPVSSVAKKWVGDIGKGFMDLLQDNLDIPNHVTHAPLRNRTSTNDTIAGTQSDVYPTVSPKRSPAPIKLIEKLNHGQNEASLSPLQRRSSPATITSMTSPSPRNPKHAHSSSSNSSSVVDSLDANSSKRSSLSSVHHVKADSVTGTVFNSRSNSAHDLLVRSSLSLILTNNNTSSYSPFPEIQRDERLDSTRFDEASPEVTSHDSEGDRTPICDLSSQEKSIELEPEDRLNSLQYSHVPINTSSKDLSETGNEVHRMPSDASSHQSAVSIRSDRMSNHQSRRSTFDFFSSATGNLTANLTKKLGDITNSETYRTSKRATMNFVDSVEKTLTEVITSDINTPAEEPLPSSLQPTLPVTSLNITDHTTAQV